MQQQQQHGSCQEQHWFWLWLSRSNSLTYSYSESSRSRRMRSNSFLWRFITSLAKFVIACKIYKGKSFIKLLNEKVSIVEILHKLRYCFTQTKLQWLCKTVIFTFVLKFCILFQFVIKIILIQSSDACWRIRKANIRFGIYVLRVP